MSKTTTSPLLWLPSAANGLSLVPSATIWTWGSWVELTSSAPSALFPAYLAALPNNGNTVAQVSAEFQVGVGAAGNERVVAHLRVRVMADQWGPMSTFPLGVLFSSIAAGSRVALRVRHGVAGDTDAYRTALGYYAATGGATGWTTTPPLVAPTGGSFVTVTSGGAAWAFGSWVEVLPAAMVPTAIMLTGIVPTAIGVPHEIQIGAGAAGAESSLITLPYATSAGGGDGFNYLRFPRPICISAGTRISVRSRSGTPSSQWFPTLWYVGTSARGGVLWHDDFEDARTLAQSGYTGVGSTSKVAGAGAGGTQGVQSSADLGEFDVEVAPSSREGSVTFDAKTSRNNVFAYVLEVRRASAWVVSVYRNDSAGGNDLEVYSNGSFTPMATAAGFWDETAFHTVKVEWVLSTYNGVSYNSDGEIRVYKDGALVVNLSAVQVSDNVGSGLEAWDNLVLAPQGELDNLDVYDNDSASAT